MCIHHYIIIILGDWSLKRPPQVLHVWILSHAKCWDGKKKSVDWSRMGTEFHRFQIPGYYLCKGLTNMARLYQC